MHLFKDQNQIEHNKLLTLVLAYTEGYITNERLRYALNIHKADIYTMLKELCNMNFLIAEGVWKRNKILYPWDE